MRSITQRTSAHARSPHESSRRQRGRGRLPGTALVVSAALLLPAGSASPAAAGAEAASSEAAATAAVPALAWGACPESWSREGVDASAFACTWAQVPLDHDDPTGPTIDLALKKLPAGDPERRLGTLFLNPGGPGGSGVTFVDSARGAFDAEVLERFDVVGFDPRGVARSTPLTCFPSLEAGLDVLGDLPAFPVGTREVLDFDAGHREYTDACAASVGSDPVIEHMSTADVARDLDLLRQAVGDEGLTYAGYSYGTHLGDVYANLFPDRVRAVLIDAVIEPVAWTTGAGPREARTDTTSLRLRTGEGTYGTLVALFDECTAAGPQLCDLAGEAESPSAQYDRLADALLAQPLQLPDGDGGTLTTTYADLVSTSLGALYSPAAYPALASYVDALLDAVDAGGAAGTAEDGVAAETARGAAERLQAALPEREDEPEQLREGTDGVLCTDGDNPLRQRLWREAAAQADREGPYFGALWVWGELPCATWPVRAEDRYTGPWDATTSSPVLVVGTRYDPATPYWDAVTVSEQLPGSRLLTLDGWGHTALGESACVDAAVARYLVDQELPAEGTVCQPDRRPFDPVPVTAAAAAPDAKADVVAAALPAAVVGR